MQWKGRRESDNVEDMRTGGGGRKGLAIGGISTVVIVVLGLLMGKNPMDILQQVVSQQGSASQQTAQSNNQANDGAASFVRPM